MKARHTPIGPRCTRPTPLTRPPDRPCLTFEDRCRLIAALTPQERQIFDDMLTDAFEMLAEGYAPEDVAQYLGRTYGGWHV